MRTIGGRAALRLLRRFCPNASPLPLTCIADLQEANEGGKCVLAVALIEVDDHLLSTLAMTVHGLYRNQ